MTTPARTRALTDLLGMNIHVSQGGSNYASTAFISDLTYMGVAVVRDNLTSPFTSMFASIGAAGIKFDFVVLNANPLVVANNVNALKSAITNLGVGNIVAIEGVNEPNLGGGTWSYNGTTMSLTTSPGYLPIAHFSADLYAALKADTATAPVPVWHGSLWGGETNNCGLQFLTIPSSYAAGLMPIGTVYSDAANCHPYPMADHGLGEFNDPAAPDNAFDDELSANYVNTWNAGGGASFPGYANVATANALRKVITECGLSTGTTGANANDVTQTIQARNILTGLCQAFRQGYQRYIIYELYDEAGELYGMFTGVGSPKTAATYLHNLMTILNDSGGTAETFTPVARGVTITGLPSPGGQSGLFQKSDGTYWVVLWNEVKNWNYGTGAAITVGSTNVGVAFDASGTINVYDPSAGTSVASTTTGTSVTVGLTDFPKVVSFTPPGGSMTTFAKNFVINVQNASSSAPARASAQGYNTQTFGPSVILSGGGQNWLRFEGAGGSGTFTNNADGSVTIIPPGGSGDGHQWNTANFTGGYMGFTGRGFGGGGYFVARMKWANGAGISPAWWSNDMEGQTGFGLAGTPVQWPGQGSDFNLWFEPDFMEAGPNDFGSSMWQWYGTGSNPQGIQPLAARTSVSNTNIYHDYGFLWVPATSTSNGFAAYDVDGREYGRVTWPFRANRNTLPPPPPTPGNDSGSNITVTTCSDLDWRHLYLILGSDAGFPFDVLSVSVWQTDASANITA